jgi:hypothetical protein
MQYKKVWPHAAGCDGAQTTVDGTTFGGFIAREMRTPLLAPIWDNTFGSSSASKDACELPAENKDSSGGWWT